MSNSKNGATVVTFGCRLNAYESQVIKDLSRQANLGDAIIVNSCAVTAEAERQVRQSIRKLRRENPDKKIIVTGCAAQINPETYKNMPAVDRVIGNQEKLSLAAYQDSSSKVLVNDIMSAKETAGHLITGFDNKARAFIQVQNGCNHRCTFCTIPYGRGNSRSVPIGEIVRQVQKLVENSYQEIVITGVDITDYGLDLPGEPTLGQMIKRLLAAVPKLQRLRLSSLDPVEMDEDMWRLIAEEPRILPHLHISLQAGDDMVLKRMKRRHLRHHITDFCARAKTMRPDMLFGADIIAGFPTETDAMFDNTLQIISDCPITFAHIFPYSPRPGTPAARMPQVEKQVIKERAAQLRLAGKQQLEIALANQVGRTFEVLIEETKNGYAFGKTNQFLAVKGQINNSIVVGSIAKARVNAHNGEQLLVDWE